MAKNRRKNSPIVHPAGESLSSSAAAAAKGVTAELAGQQEHRPQGLCPHYSLQLPSKDGPLFSLLANNVKDRLEPGTLHRLPADGAATDGASNNDAGLLSAANAPGLIESADSERVGTTSQGVGHVRSQGGDKDDGFLTGIKQVLFVLERLDWRRKRNEEQRPPELDQKQHEKKKNEGEHKETITKAKNSEAHDGKEKTIESSTNDPEASSSTTSIESPSVTNGGSVSRESVNRKANDNVTVGDERPSLEFHPLETASLDLLDVLCAPRDCNGGGDVGTGQGGGEDIRAKLKTLQGYRAKLLHFLTTFSSAARQNATTSSNEVSSIAAPEPPRTVEGVHGGYGDATFVLVGTYRILLEFSLGHEVAYPMRRALRSCLLTLRDVEESMAYTTRSRSSSVAVTTSDASIPHVQDWEDSTLQESYSTEKIKVAKRPSVSSLDAVDDSVLQSILLVRSPLRSASVIGEGQQATEDIREEDRPSSSGFWVLPAQSLGEAMSYPPLQRIVLTNPVALLSSLQFLYSVAATERPLLSKYSHGDGSRDGHHRKDDNADGQEEGGAEAAYVADSLPAVERSLQVVDALRTILLPLFASPPKDWSVESVITQEESTPLAATENEDSNDDVSKRSSVLEQIVLPSLRRVSPPSALQDGGKEGEGGFVAALDQLCLCPLQSLLSCRGTPNDGLAVTGIVYAQCRLFRWKLLSKSSSEIVTALNDDELCVCKNWWSDASLPDLNCMSVVRGYVATLPTDVLVAPAASIPPASPPSPCVVVSMEKKGKAFADEDSERESENLQGCLLCGPRMGGYILDVAGHHPDDFVRLSALKATEGLIARSMSALESSPLLRVEVRDMTESILDLLLVSWERPTTRQISCLLPRLFTSAIRLVRALDRCPSGGDGNGATDAISTNPTMMTVLRRVMDQPANRKGRYEALSALLPIVGANALLGGDTVLHPTGSNSPNVGEPPSISRMSHTRAERRNGNGLVAALVEGIGQAGSNNSGVIAELIGKILLQLRLELYEELGITPRDDDDGRHLSGAGAGKHRKQRKKKKANAPAVKDDSAGVPLVSDEPASQLPKEWTHAWAPAFARGLLCSTMVELDPSMRRRRRKQVAAFCLPLLPIIAGRAEAPYAFTELVAELTEQYRTRQQKRFDGGGTQLNVATSEEKAIEEAYIWSMLEISRYAAIGQQTNRSAQLRSIISSCLPRSVLQSALVHATPEVRMSAFSAMQTVVSTYADKGKSCDQDGVVDTMIQLWSWALPYAMKCSEREYLSSMMQSLSSFLQLIACNQMERDKSMGPRQLKDCRVSRSLLSSFAGDYLVCEVCVRHGMYPGTVFDKESFSLAAIRVVLEFALSLQAERRGDYGPRVKKAEMPKGRANPTAAAELVSVLLRREVIASLLCFLHSMWDGTRSATYSLLLDIIACAKLSSRDGAVLMPEYLLLDESRKSLYQRAIHLASSPRQRESDTGARLLAVLYSSLTSTAAQMEFLQGLLLLASNRIDQMESSLRRVLSWEISVTTVEVKNSLTSRSDDVDASQKSSCSLDDATDHVRSDGRDLPLAHGLMFAIKLVVETNTPRASMFGTRDTSASQTTHRSYQDDFLPRKMLNLCTNALSLSLAVVADVKRAEDEGDCDEDDVTGDRKGVVTQLEEEMICPTVPTKASEKPATTDGTPLNVNTGAIGANASFAALKTVSKEEEIRRAAVQRVVIGTWLLTRDSCATLARVAVAFAQDLRAEDIENAGYLLLSTLVSLKHQGGAYAAHKALQKLSEACFAGIHARLRKVPGKWIQHLLHAITARETVRNSTLRRSTGYALGFLAILRTEPKPRTLCRLVLTKLIRLSLPPRTVFLSRMSRLGLEDVFSFTSMADKTHRDSPCCEDETYEWRTRVHALNILRLAILDAPLATEVRLFAGDAVIASIIGYSDEDWAVRNSSTMVFSAVMLRVVDADKNAFNLESDKIRGNAITARELFRSYPLLAAFLRATLQDDLNHSGLRHHDPNTRNALSSDECNSYASVFPVLLLLSRLQPAAASSTAPGGCDEVIPFVQNACEYLSHPEHKVRLMAARALGALSTGEGPATLLSSRLGMVGHCVDVLKKNVQADWNACHGALLAMRIVARASTDPFILLKMALPELAHYASWFSGSCECPPSCAAVALDILFFVGGKARGEEAITMLNVLEEAAMTSLSRVEKVDGKAAVGLTDLSCRVAAILSTRASLLVFDPSSLEPTRDVQVARVKRLFQSPSFDVRWSAVKAFKKHFDTSAMQFAQDESVCAPERIKAFSRLELMLKSCLESEWKRSDLSCSLEAHGPTLRRLSRCFIELITASLSVSGQYLGAWGCSKDDWDMTFAFKELDDSVGFLLKDGGGFQTKVCAGTALTGNALELMGLGMDQLVSRFHESRDEIVEQIQAFARAVSDSSHANSPVPVRYSAAIAVGSCEFVTRCDATVHGQAGVFNTLQNCRWSLFFSALNLVQDEDEDVRLAAGSAIRSVLKPRIENALDDSPFYSASVPLFALEKSFDSLDCCSSTLAQSFIGLIEVGVSNLEKNIELLLSEFSYSETQACSKNLSSNRKIFEDEEANPFQETLVVAQVAASTLVRTKARVSLAAATRFLERCRKILLLLVSRSHQIHSLDLAHDLTHSSLVFPGLHCLFLGSMCSLSAANKVDSDSVAEASETLLCTLERRNSSSIHPLIFRAIKGLSRAREGEKEAFNAVIDSCFLLRT